MTLTDFLLARIAEDEAEARRWIASRRDWTGESVGIFFAGREERVLAECEAKRQIAEEHREQAGGGCDVCSRHEYPCPTLRFLALPYADHPDYREEWKP